MDVKGFTIQAAETLANQKIIFTQNRLKDQTEMNLIKLFCKFTHTHLNLNHSNSVKNFPVLKIAQIDIKSMQS